MPPPSVHLRLTQPSPWVLRFAPLVPAGGAVLDVACGGGRHGRWFAGRGHPVTLVDRDTTFVADLATAPGVEVITADLEGDHETPGQWPVSGRGFAAVVVANYLHRPLLPAIAAAVAPGGVLLYETFARGNERYARPRNPDHLLHPGELLRAFYGLQVVAYEAGVEERPGGLRVIERICCVATDQPVPLPPAAGP